MKNKKVKSNKHHKPFHLHLEYFFRKQYCLYVVMGLLMLAVVKGEDKMFGLMCDAYTHGYGIVGQHMREETTRVQVEYETPGRVQLNSGK